MNRRDFIRFAGATGTGVLMPFTQASADANGLGFDLSKGVRTLNLIRSSTKEKLQGMYMENGQWLPGAYENICHIMRDVRAEEVVAMDHKLIAVLDWVQRYLAVNGYTQPIYITSGYRSPKTNSVTEGAAKNSQHTLGKAIDLTIPGLSPAYLGKLMKWLSQGGVGTYDKRGFVHVDTGDVRSWRG